MRIAFSVFRVLLGKSSTNFNRYFFLYVTVSFVHIKLTINTT